MIQRPASEVWENFMRVFGLRHPPGASLDAELDKKAQKRQRTGALQNLAEIQYSHHPHFRDGNDELTAFLAVSFLLLQDLIRKIPRQQKRVIRLGFS